MTILIICWNFSLIAFCNTEDSANPPTRNRWVIPNFKMSSWKFKLPKDEVIFCGWLTKCIVVSIQCNTLFWTENRIAGVRTEKTHWWLHAQEKNQPWTDYYRMAALYIGRARIRNITYGMATGNGRLRLVFWRDVSNNLQIIFAYKKCGNEG